MSALSRWSVYTHCPHSIVATVATAVCCLSVPLAAQTPSTRVIECGSASGGRIQCNTQGYAASVRLVRDLSFNRCRLKDSWGFTGSFLWTDNQCRGQFEVTYGGPGVRPVGPGFGAGGVRLITCGTPSGAKVQCKTEGYATNVRLVRNLGVVRCQQGSNWGHTDSFIWANRGCRGEFEVTYRGDAPPRPTRVPVANTQLISCGNSDGAAMSCNAFGTVANLTLQRDRSGGRCARTSSWGLGEKSIWVARGCYGDFVATYVNAPRSR